MMPRGFLLPWREAWPWSARERAGGVMARQTYEPLSSKEQRLCEDFRKKDPALMEEMQELQQFFRTLDLPAAELDIDLLPRLKAHLAEPAPSSRFTLHARAYMASAAVACLCIGVYAGMMLLGNAPGVSPAATRPGIVALQPDQSDGLAAVIRRACRFAGNNDMEQAIATLEEGIRVHPDDPNAGEALLHLADLEYAYLQRYANAYDAYDRLRSRYPGVFASSQESMSRYSLLAEARRENFAPLRALNDARNHPANAFGEYERLVALYPNSVVAASAMDEMRTLVRPLPHASKADMAAQYEAVRSRCSDPVAAAQVDLALGDLYYNALQDRARARDHYVRAAASDHVALVQEAQQALLRME